MAADALQPAPAPYYEGWQIPEDGTKARQVIDDFYEGDYRLYGLWGAVSSGKSVASAIAWALMIEQTPKHYPLAAIGKTERSLEGNILEPLSEFLGPRYYLEKHGRGYVYIFGRKVRIYGANDIKSVSKIQGKTLYSWYGDEVTTWPKEFFMMAVSRLRIPGAKALMTMNPESPYHWFYETVVERAEDSQIRAKLYHFTMDDNPYLQPEYKAWISSFYVPGTIFFKRYILGEWTVAEGAVYPFFSTMPVDGYVIPEIPADINRYIVAMDYGQQHYTAMGLLGFSDSLNSWVLLKEHYTNNKSNVVYSQEFGREMIGAIKDGGQLLAVDIDPAGGGLSLIKQLRDDYPELYVKQAIKFDVSKEIQDLSSALYKHQLRIYSGCTKTISQLANYVWDDKAKERGKDEPLKKDDDGCDMLRYAWQRCRKDPGVALEGRYEL